MEFHYSDLCVPTDHLLSDPYTSDSYTTEYAPQYVVPAQEGEYEIRRSILVDGGDQYGVSAVVFDKFEELIWMGNQGGHVTSYYGPNMQKYTSFQIHESEEVRDIITVDQGIYCLTKSTLRHQIRRGIPRHTFKSANMVDMQCLYQASSNKLLIGGHQDKLLDLDLEKMKETIIPIQEEGCAVLRSAGGSVVACGSASGTVALRDLRSPKVAEHSFQAHTACLSDLDMQGDLLISCGFQSVNGTVIAEPYVIVWDVRCLRGNKIENGAWYIHTASPPLLLHYMPVFSGRAVALSGDGHVALVHVNSDENQEQSIFQVDTNNSVCSVLDVSATSQALVFGDQSGHLHLFSPQQNNEPVFNNFSRDTEFADPLPDLPTASFNDKTFFPSSIPLPSLAEGEKWFSELPADFFKKVFRMPKPIDPEVLKTMKMQGPIGYAPNPKTSRRNQMPYIEDTLEDLNSSLKDECKTVAQSIPKHYQKLEVQYNKNNPEEIEDLNKSGLPGLEATLPNSYSNCMLQVLYYIPPVKAILLAHTCAKEFCLSCELGFLFRMLDTSEGAPCQATNFLRAFRTVPEAAALGLIMPDRGPDARVDLIALIQSWNRFILHQIHYEILETRKQEKELAFLANSNTTVVNSSPTKRVANHKPQVAAPMVNGYSEEYQFTELEFLGPTVFDGLDGDFQHVKQDGWLAGQTLEEGAGDNEQMQNCLNHVAVNNHHAEREESEISELFAISRNQLNRCMKCSKEEEKLSVVLACALQYNTAAPTVTTAGRGEASEGRGFAELVRASLAARRHTPAWCEQCARFTPTTQRGRIVRLPPILAINCGGVTAHEKAYWAKAIPKETVESKRGGSSKPCRYGLHCARPGCRFRHPERPISSSNSKAVESLCVLPHQLVIRLQADGDVAIIDDKADQTLTESKPDPQKTKNITTPSEQEYTLCAAVMCIEDNPKNLVAYVQTAPSDCTPQWHLFNDLCIVPVCADEVVQFSAWWKTPCVVFYATPAVQNGPSPESS